MPIPNVFRRRTALLLAGTLLLAVPVHAQMDFRVRRTAQPITLDGRLTEADWSLADSVTDFRQRDPAEGAPAAEAVRF